MRAGQVPGVRRADSDAPEADAAAAAGAAGLAPGTTGPPSGGLFVSTAASERTSGAARQRLTGGVYKPAYNDVVPHALNVGDWVGCRVL